MIQPSSCLVGRGKILLSHKGSVKFVQTSCHISIPGTLPRNEQNVPSNFMGNKKAVPDVDPPSIKGSPIYQFFDWSTKVTVLIGAGISMKCGIPDYRSYSRNESGKDKQLSLCLSKRKLNFSAVTMLLWCIWPDMPNPLLAEETDLERYTDSKEGFTLLKPCSWIKVDKAGASVLFQEANMAGNNIGVVVNPVRLSSLQQFGNPHFVADKLIQAERRKESTKEAELINVAERSGAGGSHIYEFEYKVDSTRGGLKRIFSAVFVSSKKLYLLNIAHSDKPESPLNPYKRMILEQVLHSFDAANLP